MGCLWVSDEDGVEYRKKMKKGKYNSMIDFFLIQW